MSLGMFPKQPKKIIEKKILCAYLLIQQIIQQIITDSQ